MGWVLDTYEWDPKLGALKISFEMIKGLGLKIGDLREIGEVVAEALRELGKIPKDSRPVKIFVSDQSAQLYITIWSESFAPIHPAERIPPLVFDFSKEDGTHFRDLIKKLQALVALRREDAADKARREKDLAGLVKPEERAAKA